MAHFFKEWKEQLLRSALKNTEDPTKTLQELAKKDVFFVLLGQQKITDYAGVIGKDDDEYQEFKGIEMETLQMY